MPTAVEAPKASHGTTADHIKQFEKKLHAMNAAFEALPKDATSTLLKYIHQPGWTTIAEGAFFETMVDSITAQTHQLSQLHKQLTSAAALVGRQ